MIEEAFEEHNGNMREVSAEGHQVECSYDAVWTEASHLHGSHNIFSTNEMHLLLTS